MAVCSPVGVNDPVPLPSFWAAERTPAALDDGVIIEAAVTMFVCMKRALPTE